ncbi:MAG: hypothetical protein CL569_03265 [Alphaproteobacteria bacterium]|nr:hypothetical protein [Alphaproteobacteria bacterium]
MQQINAGCLRIVALAMFVLEPALILSATYGQRLQARYDLGIIRRLGGDLSHVLDELLETVTLRHDFLPLANCHEFENRS